MKLDRSMLPQGVSFDRKEGLYATLGPQGQVLHLGVYQNGVRKPGTWALEVAPDGSHARAEQVSVHEWHASQVDPDSEDALSLEDWSQGWIERIASAMKDRTALTIACSFCGKDQREVKKVIAGRSVFICDECVTLCHDILTEEARAGD